MIFAKENTGIFTGILVAYNRHETSMDVLAMHSSDVVK
jgi:hypothetical protein